MLYQNPIYGTFAQFYVEVQMRNRYHQNQVVKSMDCANKLNDFLTSVDSMEPAYQHMATEACCSVFLDYMKNMACNINEYVCNKILLKDIILYFK